MYFIVSGNVLIQVTETDKRTGCSKKQVAVFFISNIAKLRNKLAKAGKGRLTNPSLMPAVKKFPGLA